MKHLVLLTDSYPNSNGEFFLDDEVNIIAEKFERITVLCASQKKNSKRSTPRNVHVVGFPKLDWFQRNFLRIKGLFFLPLWQEFFSLKKSYGLSPSFLFFKILLEDYVRSSHVVQILFHYKLTNPEKHILYSYWQDYKALAIARIRKKTGCSAIARCHRWDVYFYANNPPYLPYRKFLLNELSVTCSISEDGISYMRQLNNFSNRDKIVLSRLGKINKKNPQLIINSSGIITICSCSTLISVKRVELIIEFIQALSVYFKINWYHFGDGDLKEKLFENAADSLANSEFKFLGIVPNNEILNFYDEHFVDLFINFSESEGIPVSIMEAQSAGIPVLATNVGGTSEIVNNENGFLVDKDFDMEKVVSIIQNYLTSSNDEKQLKRYISHENWRQNYNAETNYNYFADLINNVQRA
jgi:glycosyltransferase involved in cell wall biosynthesis